MAAFNREEASCTSLLPAVWPLRMRVSKSAMGSVMLMPGAPSPARLGETRDLATACDFADLHPRQPELAIHPARAPGDGAPLALPRGTRVARLRLQRRLRRDPLPGRALR